MSNFAKEFKSRFSLFYEYFISNPIVIHQLSVILQAKAWKLLLYYGYLKVLLYICTR